MRTSRRMLRQIRRALFAAFFFSGWINILMLATPLYTLQVFESVVPLGSMETLVVLTLIAAVAILALSLLETVRDVILLRAGLWLDHELGQHILENGLKAGLSPMDLKTASRSLEQFRSYITSSAIVPWFDTPWVPIFLVLLFVLHPVIGAVATVAAFALAICALLKHALTKGIGIEGVQAQERSHHWWGTVAAKGELTGALGFTKGATNRWESFNRAHIAASYSRGKREKFVKTIARTVRIGSQIAVYGFGAWLVIRGELTPGALVASAIMMARALGPLEQLVNTVRATQTGWQAYKRLLQLPEDANLPMVDDNGSTITGQLKLSDVSYYYPTRKTPALRGISLELKPGECVGIVGPNGSGKSTLASLIAGAISPTTGVVDLDGLPIAKLQRSLENPPVGYLTDEPVLIEGTVHENIASFTDVSLMSTAHSAMLAGVHETLHALPNGYDTLVGPSGSFLALRERRAVSLARAVHAHRKLIVLDEPEVGLDGSSLRRFLKVFSEIKANGTSLVIATQDPRVLTLTDKVLVLSNGTIHSMTDAHALNAGLKSSNGNMASNGAPTAKKKQSNAPQDNLKTAMGSLKPKPFMVGTPPRK